MKEGIFFFLCEGGEIGERILKKQKLELLLKGNLHGLTE